MSTIQTIGVLLVDDDPQFTTYLHYLLQSLTTFDCRVTTAATARAALPFLFGDAPADICLLDHYLPDELGVDLLQTVRARGCRVPIVLLTGNGDADVEQAALGRGASDYLEKHEIDARSLERAFRHALSRAKATAESEATALRFRALVEHDWDGLFVMDSTSTIEYAGPSSLRILGYAPSELVGTRGFDLLHPDDRPRIEALWVRNLANPGVRLDAGCRFRHKLGHYIHIVGAGTSHLHDPAVRGFVLNFRDESGHRELETRLQQAQKLEAIGRLAAGVAHDFNNVLTVILGSADRLLQWFPAADPATEPLREIRDAAQRASVWTGRLLAFGRQQVTEPRALDLKDIVRGSESMLRRMAGDPIACDIDVSPDPQPIFADPSQIEQVLLNLVVNARDAMPEGGRLTITVDTTDTPVGADGAGRWVRLTVTDTGVGMDASVRAQIFEPFFTTKGALGTGLGLSTVYGAVRQTGGHINVVSSPGEGSTFAIYFPWCGLAVGDLDEGPPIPAAWPARVLVVDDEPAVRQFVASALVALGYEVRSAASTADATSLIDSPEIGIDLLLTDLILPDGDGHGIARSAIRARGKLPVLFMSGYAPVRMTSEALSAGGHLLRKPFTVAALSRKVHETLAGAATGQADRDSGGSAEALSHPSARDESHPTGLDGSP